VNGYLTLIDLVVVAGAAVVCPLALGRWTTAWVAVAGSTALAFSVEPGPGALVWALPWPLLAAAATADAVRTAPAGADPRPLAVRRSSGPGSSRRGAKAVRRRASRWPWSRWRDRWHRDGGLDRLASVAAPGFALVAGVGLVVSCGDLGVLHFGEPITRLAAVHFTFAGVATTALGRAVVHRAPTRTRCRAATAGLALAIAAPPVVGVGFVTEAAVAQVGGAVLMALAAYLIAGCQLAEAWPLRRTRVGRLLAVSGLSVWVPMVLAVAWALGQHTGGPALSIPDMARIHGSLNAFGFVGCGLAARWLATSAEAEQQVPLGAGTLRPA
jgi:hypothetical protein